MKRPKLPVGIENFQEIRQADFYYVDKTRLIEQLIDQWGKVNLFTRPRRFGKTLNMSMLRHFFEIGTDPALFEGLYISENPALCEEYMGKFPVVSISLKGINSSSFDGACRLLNKVINEECRRLGFLEKSQNLTKNEKSIFRELLKSNLAEDTLVYSLRELTELLEKLNGVSHE